MYTLPHNEEFEKAVLVCILTDPTIYPKISTIIGPQDFFKATTKAIYEAITETNINELDSLTVQDKLSGEYLAYFKELVADSSVPTISNAVYYAEAIKDKSRLREGIKLGTNISTICYTEEDTETALQEVEHQFSAFMQQRVHDDDHESSIDAFKSFMETIKDRKDDSQLVKTGFRDLDLLLQSLEGLVILAAQTSVGKTNLALSFLLNNLKASKNVLMFSLEQPKKQLFQRLLSMESQVPMEEIRLGLIEGTESASVRLLELFQRLHVDDTPAITTNYIASVVRQKQLEWGKIDLIIVDYLHLLKLNDKKGIVEGLGDACKDLRALGKEIDAPVVLISQLSRGLKEDKESAKAKRPTLSDLRSSGEIEQVADLVMFIYRESYFDMPGLQTDEDTVEIIVRKARNGRPGIVPLLWYPRTMTFKNERMMTTTRK